MSAAYVHAVDSVNRLLRMDDTTVTLMAKGTGTTVDGERTIWRTERDALSEAHLFEFPSRVARLLSLTNNEPHPVKLPFPVVFIDCEFDLEGEFEGRPTINHYFGILLWQHTNQTSATATSFVASSLRVRAENRDETDRLGYLVPELQGQLVPGQWAKAGDVTLPVNIAYPVGTGYEGELRGLSRYARSEWRVVQNMTLNFLDLLDTPDVMLVPVHRTNKRRERLGKAPLPDGDRVVLRPSLARYLDQIESGSHFQYSHRFWVRGHFKHWRDERYAASGKQDTVTWTYPYVKGEGLLIKKRYELPEGKRVSVSPTAEVSLTPGRHNDGVL
jgi:hypothetical protein